MPWKTQPEWLQVVVGYLSILLAAGIGVMARIAHEVKAGNRRKFFSRALWLEVPGVLMVTLAVVGAAEQMGWSPALAGALGSWAGWLGPKAVVVFVGKYMRK